MLTDNLDQAGFFIFGAGNRDKLIYKNGRLFKALNNDTLFQCEALSETIEPAEYRVTLRTVRDEIIIIREDEEGIFLDTAEEEKCLAASRVILPGFNGHPYARELRILHHEVLINIVNGLPLPNFLVYDQPWYRDAAMMAMVLEQTGNIDLIREWISNLEKPFDNNNAGQDEPDNLGQLLYLAALIDAPDHPIIETVLKSIDDFTKDDYIVGLTDGGERPVYQTAWLKYGLNKLGLDDPYTIPEIEDKYAVLAWWDQGHIKRDRIQSYFPGSEKYPYLTWAEAHFFNRKPPMDLTGADYPLTWEAQASEADYSGMEIIDPEFTARKLSMPHTWHAAEMFLYLGEKDRE